MNPREKLALAKEKFGLEQGVGILMGVGSFGENYDHDPTIWSGIDSSMDGYKPVFHLDEIEESVFADLESRVISMKSTKGQGDEAVFYGATAYRHKFLPKEDFMPAFPLYAFFRAYVLDYAAEFGERKNEVFETLFPPIQAVDLEALKAGLQSEVPPKWLDIWPYVPLTVEYVTDCAEYLARYPSDDDVFLYGGIATAEQFANWQASEGLEMEGALWNEYHAGGDKLPDDIPPAPFEDETPLPIRGEDEKNPPTKDNDEPVAQGELIVSGSITVDMIRSLLNPEHPRFSEELAACVKVWCSFELPEDEGREEQSDKPPQKGPVPDRNTSREAVRDRLESLFKEEYGIKLNFTGKNNRGDRMTIVTNWDKTGRRKKK